MTQNNTCLLATVQCLILENVYGRPLKKQKKKNRSSAERGNIRPLGFLVWKELLHYLNLVTKISIMYFDR